jgi:hypothetical protein
LQAGGKLQQARKCACRVLDNAELSGGELPQAISGIAEHGFFDGQLDSLMSRCRTPCLLETMRACGNSTENSMLTDVYVDVVQ